MLSMFKQYCLPNLKKYDPSNGKKPMAWTPEPCKDPESRQGILMVINFANRIPDFSLFKGPMS